jgi:hypothetical protein
MNTTNIIKLAAALAWAGLAISNAPLADATCLTSEAGDYAACTAIYTTMGNAICGYEMTYRQNIKFMSTSCSTGSGCNATGWYTWTDMRYPSGRKPTYSLGFCWDGSGWLPYDLGSCAC